MADDMRLPRPHAAALGIILAGIAFVPDWAAAQPRGGTIEVPGGQNTNAPVLFSAEELSVDSDLGIVVARGKVEMTQDQRTLMADVVSYNQRTNTATASGNVSILEPTGDVIFADYVELQEGLREGFVRNVRMLMTDGGRMAGNDATRTGGNRTELDQGVYSPCDLCKTDPTRAPMWQIRAARVIHDQERKVVQYRDATMEIMGVPIAYTPYFSHPDPTVKRQSGFLPDDRQQDRPRGFVRVPYYFVLSDSMDFTFDPIITTQQGIVLGGEFRQRLRNGFYEIEASGTVADRTTGTDENPIVEQNQFRGHVKGKGRIDIDNTWRAGIDLARATDKTYMRRYGYGSEESLTTRLFAEGFRGRSYAEVAAYAFQGLRPEDRDTRQPIVAPTATVHYLGEPNELGAYWSVDANILNLYREDGTDSRRISINGGWQMPWQSPLGDRYVFAASLRGDAYWAKDVPTDDSRRRQPDQERHHRPHDAAAVGQLELPLGPQRPRRPVPDRAGGDAGRRAGAWPPERRAQRGQPRLRAERREHHAAEPLPRPRPLRWRPAHRLRPQPRRLSRRRHERARLRRPELQLPGEPGDAGGLRRGGPAVRHRRPVRRLAVGVSRPALPVPPRQGRSDAAATRDRRGRRAVLAQGLWQLHLPRPADQRARHRPARGARHRRYGANLQLLVRLRPRHDRPHQRGDLLDSAFGAKYEDECFAIVVSYRRTRTRDLDIEPSDAILVRLFFKNLGEFGLPRVDLM